MAKEDPVATGPLTEDENRQLREIMRSQQHVRWLYSTLRIWATWIAAVVGGLYALLQITKDGLKALIGGGH